MQKKLVRDNYEIMEFCKKKDYNLNEGSVFNSKMVLLKILFQSH